MERPILLRPDLFSMFGPEAGHAFYLVSNRGREDAFAIECVRHVSGGIIPIDADAAFEDVIASIPEGSNILVISPDRFISSLTPTQLGRRRLAVLAANSTPCTDEAIAHFIAAIESTSVSEQLAFSRNFFGGINKAEGLVIRNDEYGTRAEFDFRDPQNKWFFQGGPLAWGQQQIVPAGEISVLPLAHGEFDGSRRLKISGTIALAGYAILHNGRPSFERADQARLYDDLLSLEKAAVICEVDHGTIVEMRASSAAALPALKTLEAMCHIDSRYRILWELGIGINTSLRRLPGNFAMNEVYGSSSSLLHVGIGLTPFTQYHLDVILPGTVMTNLQGDEVLAGMPSSKAGTGGLIVPDVSEGCPCLPR